jgi:hypothetical protein
MSHNNMFDVNNSYFVGPNPIKTAALEAEASEATKKPSLTKQLADAVRDMKIEYLGKNVDGEDEASFERLWEDITSEYPDHLQLYVAKLKYLDAHPKRMERLKDVVRAAKAVVGLISEESLAQGLGRNIDREKTNSGEVRLFPISFKHLLKLTTELLVFAGTPTFDRKEGFFDRCACTSRFGPR